MSVSYWGDLFYGINRSQNNVFDEDKEKKFIINAMKHLHYSEEEIKEIEEEHCLDFESLNELDENLITSSMYFLKDKIEVYHQYCCNNEILFFGISPSYPWELKEIVTQEEINRKIYEAIKPVLKDNVTFEQVAPLFKKYCFNGADDYIKYYSY